MTDMHDPQQDRSRESYARAGAKGGGGRDYGGTCSLCGHEYDHRLADHLPECDAR